MLSVFFLKEYEYCQLMQGLINDYLKS